MFDLFEIDFEFYRYAFCIVVGAVFGLIYLTYRVMTKTTGIFGSFADRDEYGDVTIFSGWNVGFAVVFMILVFMFFSSIEGSTVNVLLHDSWVYTKGAYN